MVRGKGKRNVSDSASRAKLKGKNWYTIVAPKLFGSKEVGETIAREDKDIIGRKIDVSIPDVTNDMSKYYMKAVFQIDKVEAGKAHTRLSELEILKDYISRMIQRRIRRVDSIDTVKTKDGVLIKVKSVAITLRRVNNSTKSLVRAEMKKVVEDLVSKNTLNQLVNGILKGKLQEAIKGNSSKVYPIRNVEVRRLQVLKPSDEETPEEPIEEAQTA